MHRFASYKKPQRVRKMRGPVVGHMTGTPMPMIYSHGRRFGDDLHSCNRCNYHVCSCPRAENVVAKSQLTWAHLPGGTAATNAVLPASDDEFTAPGKSKFVFWNPLEPVGKHFRVGVGEVVKCANGTVWHRADGTWTVCLSDSKIATFATREEDFAHAEAKP